MSGLLKALGLLPRGQRGAGRAAAGEAASFGPLRADLSAARAGLVDARDGVMEAMSSADAQVRRLQALLAVHPDPDLKEIAGSSDLGLNALTGNHRVRVLAALRDLELAAPDALPAVLARTRTLVAGFDAHIRSSERLAACDDNPFGVPVNVRSLLGPALKQLARAVERFAA